MFFVAILLILVLLLLIAGRRGKHQPPGPFPWPFIGSHFLLKRLTRKLGGQHLAFIELCKRYNSNVIALGSGASKVLIVSGNKYIQTVMKNEEFDGRPWNQFIEMRNMGRKQGITMNDGTEWKELRSWMVRTMRFFGFGKREMSEMIKHELSVIVEKLKKGGIQRVKPAVGPAVINVLWTLATGQPFCEGQKLQYFTNLMERRARVFDMVGGILSAFPWFRYIAPEISGYNLLSTLNKELKDFLLETIMEHRKQYTPGKSDDLIDMFIHEMINENNSSPIFTEDQLVMVLVDLFLAGCTTTSTTLDFLFLNMVVNQDVQHKLQKEIDSVIPSDRLPDLEDRPKLHYVEAVITESYRLCPVLPIIGPRRVLRDTVLGGYDIPKDSTILINAYSIGADPYLYPEPHIFKPERFLKDGVYEPDVNLLPFGKGKRRCPGEALAKSALFLIFTGVMQKYSLLPVPGKGPTSIEIIPGLAMSPKPYDILIKER